VTGCYQQSALVVSPTGGA